MDEFGSNAWIWAFWRVSLSKWSLWPIFPIKMVIMANFHKWCLMHEFWHFGVFPYQNGHYGQFSQILPNAWICYQNGQYGQFSQMVPNAWILTFWAVLPCLAIKMADLQKWGHLGIKMADFQKRACCMNFGFSTIKMRANFQKCHHAWFWLFFKAHHFCIKMVTFGEFLKQDGIWTKT